MTAAAQHPNITLYTCSEVQQVGGYIGNFEVTIKKNAKYVDYSKCTGCGLCETKCPSKKISSEFDENMGNRTAIYKPFVNAVPAKPTIDKNSCKKLIDGKCGVCAKVCPTGAINYEDQDEIISEKFGAIVMATGFDLINWGEHYPEYGGGTIPDVVSGMQFERLVNASGPTEGKIKRPSDGETPKTVVFVKCVGSRDVQKGKSYCSRACCMYTAKHAHQVLDKVKDSDVYIFYMDVRTPGKMYDEFYMRTREEDGAKYIRGQVSKIYQDGNKIIVRGEDTLIGESVEVEADMVVLETAMVPRADATQLAQSVGFSYDKDGWFTEAHPKLRPVETNTGGVFLSGVCQGPKDVPDTVAQASAAAVKVLTMFSKDEMATNPQIASCNEATCVGCLLCKPVCPYKAIEAKEISERVHGETVTRTVASVNSGLCQGCGACTAECRSGSMNLRGFTNLQLLAEVDAACL